MLIAPDIDASNPLPETKFAVVEMLPERDLYVARPPSFCGKLQEAGARYPFGIAERSVTFATEASPTKRFLAPPNELKFDLSAD